MRRTLIGLSIAVPMLASCGRSTPQHPVSPEDPRRMTLRLTSPAFGEGREIPRVYTCDGKDVSPPLAWTGVPESTRALALIGEDPDAPGGTWTHWVIFNLPAGLKELREGIPPEERVSLGPGEDAIQGRNDFGKIGYGGPCPPTGTHHYVFRLYALDTRLGLARGTEKGPLIEALQGHVVAEGRLTGTYARSKAARP
jgi:Raf kinase inhibitor-like YbhB/YbcL family protein